MSIATAPTETARHTCTRCVMDTSDPDIRFDQNGVCNHCHDYDARSKMHVFDGEAGRAKLAETAALIKADGAGKAYDCIIGVSGGVDSTYVAWKVKELGLRPLAVHLDNGWDSEIAVSNISACLVKLGIDLHTHVIDWVEFKDIQRAFLLASTPDAEIPSDHAIFAILYRVATQHGLRHVITGLNVRTETHVPLTWSQGHWDWGYIRAVHRQFGSGRIKTFPHFSFREFSTMCRHSHETTNLLDYMDYAKKDALVFLQGELGWKDYGGKHFESIYTRWFQGCYLPIKFGFDKRRSHLSSLICSGEITRQEALEKLESPPYSPALQQQDCEYVAKKLDFSPAEFEAMMTASPRRHEEFPSYHKRTHAWWYPFLLRANRVWKRIVLRQK
ncbi:MAG: N-acetyl sugar amidotransferase [Prosthecobacter sp.]|uniref:N-acetyl sugar amidotransferase n=1 Tax=Prosthecobacter sp. TaxID=1965333 RepID=UPI0038FF8A76